LITPERLRRKRNNAQIKEDNRKVNEQLMKKYKDAVRALRRPVTVSKKVAKK
jgi:hypothetical protein